ncbi:LOW QUALITY PROTEIN: RPL14 isoform 5 [Pongo abelii]|uniref:RPL14 isoform 5 n=1 Tax=Pongo abelii TaxID=9601 RepID=A0A2J8WXY4_PONAB|nr:LOW QUALITY PROTEIN: RPL14 isoform 5 [Pongo abelii]
MVRVPGPAVQRNRALPGPPLASAWRARQAWRALGHACAPPPLELDG